jgi:hypothetical protein
MSDETSNEPKAGKGQFKCYKCRKIYQARDGDWYNWESMEVHLCHKCEKETKGKDERSNTVRSRF